MTMFHALFRVGSRLERHGTLVRIDMEGPTMEWAQARAFMLVQEAREQNHACYLVAVARED